MKAIRIFFRYFSDRFLAYVLKYILRSDRKISKKISRKSSDLKFVNTLSLSVLRETKPLTKKERYEQEVRAACEAYWASASEPKLIERLRREKMWGLIAHFSPVHAIDLGCGRGELATLLQNAGHTVTALDAHPTLLDSLAGRGIETQVAILPYTNFPDARFELVLCTDVVAELSLELHRMLLSEIARILVNEGLALISTPLDTKTLNPQERFAALVETEFKIIGSVKSALPAMNLKKRWLIGALEGMADFIWGGERVAHIAYLCKKKSLF